MKTWVLFLVAILASPIAVYRITKMISGPEEGPWKLLAKLKERYPPLPDNQGGSWVGRGLRCPKCVSFWAGPFVAGLLLVPVVGPLAVIGLALSGMVVWFFERGPY